MTEYLWAAAGSIATALVALASKMIWHSDRSASRLLAGHQRMIDELQSSHADLSLELKKVRAQNLRIWDLLFAAREDLVAERVAHAQTRAALEEALRHLPGPLAEHIRKMSAPIAPPPIPAPQGDSP